MNWDRTKEVIPDGVQTLSKMPERHVRGIYPNYIDRAQGPNIYCGTETYLDYPMGLGAVILGHAHPEVTVAIKKQADNGTIYSLSSPKETELAELLCNLIPSAEMCRFLKTGSEATSAAVKIARTYTNRKKVIACGYHGWHDWYSATCKPAGCVDKNVIQLPYNDLEAFKKKINKNTAAVIIEPYVYDEPKEGFLIGLKNLCRINGAVLIFDEVVTGFRTKKLTAQALFKIEPDLTCLGKAMGNGMPISCVCGNKDIMKVLERDCFVSSTFGGELLSITAALKTIEIIEGKGYHPIEAMGSRVKEGFNRYAENYGLESCRCVGYPQRTKFEFPSDEHRSLFWQECLRWGVFFGYAQFISYAHGVPEIDKTVAAMKHALDILRKYPDPAGALDGKVATPALREEVKNGTLQDRQNTTAKAEM
ncbi:MAG: aspartate aminotransferase family protein [Planctomycetota bacterium]